MRNLHRSMMLSEHNLAAAMTQRDASRFYLISDYLMLVAANPVTDRHPCIDAMRWLHEAVASAGFVIDLDAMTVKIDDSKAIDLRPEQARIDKGYEDGLSKYKTNITDCEQQIGVAATRRVMPDRLPWAK